MKISMDGCLTNCNCLSVNFLATLQEDINKLIEEGELQCKLNELDKLEEKAKDNSEPAWLVTFSVCLFLMYSPSISNIEGTCCIQNSCSAYVPSGVPVEFLSRTCAAS